MKKNKTIFPVGVDIMDTMEAYFKNVIFRNNNLIIPYMNIGISEHELNIDKKIKYLNYAYLVAEDVSYLSTWIPQVGKGKRLTIINGSIIKDNLFYWGGTNLDENSVFNDMEICSKYAYLQILDITKMSSEVWSVVNTEKSSKHADEITRNFFNGTYIPDNIAALIK